MDKIWSGPKIGQFKTKYIGFYNLQVDKDEVPEEILEIESLLMPNEFRKDRAFGHLLLYQFITPINKDDYQSYQRGLKDLNKTTADILAYAKSRAMSTGTATSKLSQPQVKDRLDREKRWKDWYEKYVAVHRAKEEEYAEFRRQHINSQKLKYQSKLLNFQVDHVKNLLASLKTYNTTLDASDTGTGKTYSAFCLARELNLIPIIVCPKSVIPRWEEAGRHFDLTLDDFYVANYEKFRVGSTPYLERLSKDNPVFKQIANNTVNPSWQKADYDRQQKLISDQLSKVPQTTFYWKLDPDKHLLIFDECHKVKNSKTLNYSIYWWARQQKLKILSLSATVADKIDNAYSIAYMLKLVENSKDFRTKYQVETDQNILKDFGYELDSDGRFRFNESYRQSFEEFKQSDQNLSRLHEDLFPLHGARMIIEEMGDLFPDNFVDAQTFDMDQKAEQIQATYREMERKILEIKVAQALARDAEIKIYTELQRNNAITPEELSKLTKLRREKIQDEAQIELFCQKLADYGSKIQPGHLLDISYQKSEGTNKSNSSDDDNSNNSESNSNADSNSKTKSDIKAKKDEKTENILTIRLRAWQRVELLKADTLLDLAKEFLEEGKSVVIFVNFNDTLDYIRDNILSIRKDVSIIRGGQTLRERQRQIELFQDNKHKIILANIRSGGVGISLHDLHGGHPRVSLISPSWSAQDLVQALGRIHRAEGKSKCQQYLIFCARTIEDQICEAIKKKLKTIKAINDGDLTGGLSF